MSQDCPPLVLDDIVHLMSPSPVPQSLLGTSDIPPRPNSPSPEPLPDSDIVHMRRKVAEMRHNDKSDVPLTKREMELAEMVLRLTAMIRPDSDQLFNQAEMISALTQQRDLLLYQAEEQRLRWNSEKDGWARMAEALLVQQAKNRLGVEHDENPDRLHVAEADNKGLRQRLHETQSRLQILESELTRLRPLLLMQPLISHSPMPPPTPNPKTPHSRRRKKDPIITEDEEHGASEDEGLIDLPDTPSHVSHSQATPRTKSRRSEAPNPHPPLPNPHKRRSSQKAASRGLSADARAEHLLLAARKIGKYRVGIVSGMTQYLEEQERERRREETAVASTPKTPKRNTSHTGYSSEGGYVYLNGQLRPGPGMQPVPLFIPAYPHHLLQTPSSSTTAPSAASSAQHSSQKPKQRTRTNNPTTPLDSLLTAARSMMQEDIDVGIDEDEEVDVVGDSTAKAARTRHAKTRDMLGSPVPKRRRIAAGTDKASVPTNRTMDNVPGPSVDTSGPSNAGVGRVMSALDVLADQAAAFSTQEQPLTPSQVQTKSKGKERVDMQPQDPSSVTPKPRTRTKPKKDETDPVLTVSPASHSSTPRIDLEDNLTGTTHTAELDTGGPASEVLVDPGGGLTNINASNSSSQTLDSRSLSEGNLLRTDAGTPSPRLPDISLGGGEKAYDMSGYDSRIAGEEERDVPQATNIAQRESAPLAMLLSGIKRREESPSSEHSEAVPSGGQTGESSGSAPIVSVASVKNRELVRVVEQDMPASVPPVKRQRSPYVKWSKEEDDLLAQAVAKYGQKWDLVQKALPSRGYHQVRQRWLRKLGVFDSKPDLSSFQTAATTFPSTSRGDGAEPRGNPKLGLAPLSSERAFSSGLVGRPPSLPS